MPKAFSQTSIAFDHPPQDAELVWLLGDPDHPGALVVRDTPESLSAQAALIPLKFLAVCVLSVAVPVTLLPWLGPRLGLQVEEGSVWAMILLVWLAIVPAMFGIAYGLHRYFAAKGDYFRVDKSSRTLTLGQVQRTLEAADIVEFVELRRYYRPAGAWDWTRQIGVLARGREGGYEYLPVARENLSTPFRRSLTNCLSEIYGVPIRRVKLTALQSKQLGDC